MNYKKRLTLFEKVGWTCIQIKKRKRKKIRNKFGSKFSTFQGELNPFSLTFFRFLSRLKLVASIVAYSINSKPRHKIKKKSSYYKARDFLSSINKILTEIITMTTTPSTEIQQLKEFIKDGFNELKGEINQLDRKFDDKFNQLDRKIDTVNSELKQEITQIKSELKQEITQIKSELKQEMSEIRGDIKTIDARQKNVETAVQKIPEITEKFGELKNWRQIAFIIIAAVVGWFARSGRM